MLTKVILTDFQAHKHLEVDCAGFTTLTGGSNGGKSAVLRAIQGLVRNFSATDYVRHGQKTLSVKLLFDDGFKVEWIKGTGENKYILTDSEGNSRTFDKVGSDVPDEVKEVLRLGPIAIKGSDKEYVNFHNQLEAPFLISSTPGSVAKLFGELTSASDLYSAVSEGNRQSRSINGLKTTRKADYEEVVESLEGFVDLDKQIERLESGRTQFDAANNLFGDLKGIEALTTRIKDKDTKIKEALESVSELEVIEDVDLSDVGELAATYFNLKSLVAKATQFDEYEKAATELVTDLGPAEDLDILELERESTSLVNLKEIMANISGLEEKITTFNGSIEDSQGEISQLESEIVEKMSSLDSCPECEQDLTESAKVALVEGRSEHATC